MRIRLDPLGYPENFLDYLNYIEQEKRWTNFSFDYDRMLELIDERVWASVIVAGRTGETRSKFLGLLQIAANQHPMTIRACFYQAVSAGIYSSTAKPDYSKCCNHLGTLRNEGVIPFHWFTDNTRYSIGGTSELEVSPENVLQGYIDRSGHLDALYNRHFWLDQKKHVQIMVEKDALVGTIEPVTEAYGVQINVLKGQASITFVYEVAEKFKSLARQWKADGKQKVIHAFYLGDHDPAGLLIEDSFKWRVESHFKDLEVPIVWERIAITEDDFNDPRFRALSVKNKDVSAPEYVRKYGNRCVEVDAIPPNEMRERVKQAIEDCIDKTTRAKTEQLERIGKARLEITGTKLEQALKGITLATEAEAKRAIKRR